MNTEIVSIELRSEMESESTSAQDLLTELQEVEISSQEDLVDIAEILTDVKKRIGRLEEQRSTITKPQREALDAVYALFKPVIDYLKKCEAKAKQLIVEANERAERKRREALEVAGEASMQGDARTAASAMTTARQNSFTAIKGVGLRKNWTYRVIDASKVPKAYLMINHDAVMTAIREHKEHTNIPGIEVYAESSVAASRK